ncbi:MAG: cytochrome C, partial [candidate division Zixibacteria bacterium]|nr:cytochrome C [candidate division Zixibacteria bacterium]
FYLSIFIISSIAVFLLGLFLVFKSSHLLQKVVTLLLVVIGLAWIGGFEYVRELARRPYVISDLIYSNSIFVKDQEKLNEEGVLAHAVWVEHREITEENKFEVGREIFRLQCQSCHSIGGIRNDIVSRSGHLTHLGIKAQLTGQGKIRKYMPEFVGTDEEMEALAAYISFWIHGYKPSSDLDKYNLAGVDQNVPEFDHKNDDYVLLVWNDLGMHCISDSDPWFVILPPANTLEAQLIKRGETPEKVISGAKLTYKVEPGFENPSAHVPFWDYEDKNFGVELQENVGLFGLGLEGEMHFDPERVAYIAEAIPVVPYNDDGSFNPYPLFTVEARDSASGELLISTKVVAPTSTEMGCRNCHGGDWAVNDIAGVSEETAVNILKAHDRLSGTNLHEEALNGNPKLCASCHGDPALGTEGKAEHLYMSQAVHGWHASYMPVEGGDACVLCHPAFMHGQTRCNRGVHGALGKTCDHCHGTLSDHAAALLKAQIDRPSAKSLLEPLEPVQVASIDDINPRMPWIQEPDCITCHVDFEQPSPDARAFNVWNEEFSELYRMRTGYAGIRCEACHNSPHSLYPAFNMFSHDRDNLQPLQYSGMRYPLGSNESCEVCHTIEMDFTVHHENMLRPFRNHDLIEEIHKDIRPTQVSR